MSADSGPTDNTANKKKKNVRREAPKEEPLATDKI